MTEQLQSLDPYYKNFIDGCRSEYTKRNYEQALNYFMSFLGLSPLDYDKLLTPDPLVITNSVCQWIVKMHESGLSSTTIAARVAGIQMFYAMNDLVLNWKKIKKYMPEHEKTVEDRPYTHSEIKKLLEHTSLRNRAIILLMCSSGCRVGAIPDIRIKDLVPINEHGVYRVVYYWKSQRYRYTSFCTPEARKEIDQYLDYRRRWGERITEESPLFRREYDPNHPETTVSPITDEAIRMFMKTLLQQTGLRQPGLEGKTTRRHNIMLTHGLRKFYETNAFRAGMNEEYIRRLMGHRGGKSLLSDTYNKIQEEELLNGDSKHVGYIGIIDQLTINEENRLKREVKVLRKERLEFGAYQEFIDKKLTDLGKRLGFEI